MQIFKIFIVGFSFCLFGIICILGDIIFIPVILFGLQRFRCIRFMCRFCVRYSWKAFIYYIICIRFCKSNAKILESLGESGEIIVCNHPSLIDIVFFISFVKNANCIVKGDLARNVFLFAAIRACGYILNTENEECLIESCKALENGESLIVFPEGSRTREKIVFHKAASYIAIKSAKTLTPIFLHMNPRSLKKGQSWYKTPNILIQYEFKMSKRLEIDGFYPDKSAPIRARLLNSYLQEIYNKEFASD